MKITAEKITQELQHLRNLLVGDVVESGHPSYEEARRVWNGMIDLRPRAVVRAGAVADIDPVLAAAQRLGLPLAVRGGGHNVAGHGTVDGGLVLDLSGLRRVDVDPDTHRVTVEPGALLADVDEATAPYRLAVPLGVISATGVAGLTLGGGVGWLTRSNGLALDNLISAEVVTGAGEHLSVDEGHHPDLFWGLRGGGGNFGVISSFVFRARLLPAEVLGGNLIYRPGRWREALQAFARWSTELPDEMNTIISILRLPPEFEAGEEPVMAVGVAWVGDDREEGKRLIDRLRAEAPPDTAEVGPVQWPAWQSALDTLFPKGSRGYWKNVSFSRLDEEVIDVLVGFASEITWYGTGIDIHLLRGVFGRVPEEATAFPNRYAKYWLNVYGYWSDPGEDERLTAFARNAHAAMAPYAEHGQYVNFLGAEPDGEPVAAARAAYGDQKYRRLGSVL